MTQDWLQDPRLKAAAFSGSATNKAYSYAERLALAMQAIEILENLVRDQDRRLEILTRCPSGCSEAHTYEESCLLAPQ